jgi:tRNA(Ile)-lysidine synthetase-like protein
MVKSKWNINILENKHLNYIIEKSKSSKRNFSLDLPRPLILTATNSTLFIKDLNHINNLELDDEMFINNEGEFTFNSLKLTNYYSSNFTEKVIKDIYWSAQVNGDKNYYTIKVRFPEYGDKYHVYGEKTSKNLSKLFIEKKIPKEWRKDLPIFETKGKILLVAGLPPAKLAKVDPESNKVFNLKLLTNNLFK